jgi:two-component system, chemotaxis family, sensor kinase CheA
VSQDLFKYFRLEARELVDKLHAGMLEIDRSGGGSGELVRTQLRATHTLKGAARAVRHKALADHAHAIEDALDAFRDAGGVTRAAIDAVLSRLDAMERDVRALGKPPDEAAPAAPVRTQGKNQLLVAATDLNVSLTAELKSTNASDGGITLGAKKAVPAVLPALPLTPEVDDSRTLRAEIGDMDVVLDGVAEAHAAIGTLRRLAGELEQAHRLAEIVTDQLAPRLRERERSAEHVHVTAAQLVGSLGAVDRNLGAAIEKLDRELRTVRNAAEQLRLVPARALFTALERAARDAARVLGKQVVFDTAGGDVRLDARLLTAVQPALVQLVRNALAHGIELPGERERSGKPRAGRVAIEVERRARRVSFRCRDDGRGVDAAVLRELAVRRGLLPAAAGAPGAGELIDLLLRGGMSTAATVNEIAGRGIGLDVVRDAAVRLGGRVRLTSEPGAGAVFELDVPVSLTSFDALAVEDAGIVATIPLVAVRRALRVAPGDIVATPEGAAIVYDEQVIPFLPLRTVLGRAAAPRAGAWSAAVVAHGDRLVALGVGRVLGTATIVVRPMPELAPCDPVIGGASLDADGNPQLVLDPAGLVAARPRALEAAPRHRPRVLVIDDSVTTRMLEQSILESAGYQVDLAVSAEDGLVRARAHPYSLYLVDVEMPGMDGFSFIEQIQRDAVLRDTPAILVTSRASPADRARGREVGARGFIAKGEFDQGALLDQIARLVA